MLKNNQTYFKKCFPTRLFKYVWPIFNIVHERVDVLQYPATIASRYWKVLKQRGTLVQSELINVKLTFEAPIPEKWLNIVCLTIFGGLALKG